MNTGITRGCMVSSNYQLKVDALVKSIGMAKQKFRYTRSSGVEGAEAYIWYVEHLRTRYDAVDRTFCDAIKSWSLVNILEIYIYNCYKCFKSRYLLSFFLASCSTFSQFYSPKTYRSSKQFFVGRPLFFFNSVNRCFTVLVLQ